MLKRRSVTRANGFAERTHQIGLRDDAHQPHVGLHDGNAADLVVAHQDSGLLEEGLRGDHDGRLAHDLADPQLRHQVGGLLRAQRGGLRGQGRADVVLRDHAHDGTVIDDRWITSHIRDHVPVGTFTDSMRTDFWACVKTGIDPEQKAKEIINECQRKASR